MRGGVWRRAEQQMFSLLPKVSGDARERLVEIVREAGAADQARRMLHARSLVVRCRGAHRLGALGEAADVPALAARPADRSFRVRRDRTGVLKGTSVAGRVDLEERRYIKK